MLTVKAIKKLFKAKDIDEVVEVGKDFVESFDSLSENATLLEIKEYCRNIIYEKESLFKTALTVPKTGAFKFDSVLKEVEMECMRKNFHYNADFWKGYVTEEVTKMKEVK